VHEDVRGRATPLSGDVTLSFESVSVNIDASYPDSADTGAAVQSSLRALGGSLASVTVSRTTTVEEPISNDDDSEGWVYSITFTSSGGNAAGFVGDTSLVSADTTLPTVEIEEIVTGTGSEVQIVTTSTDAGQLSGHWFLAFDGEETNNLAFNADATDVETELEALTGVGDVSVTRSALGGDGGCSWSITFDSPDYYSESGELPLLYAGGADSASPVEMLASTSGTAAVDVVREASGNLEPLTGSLTVAFDGASTEVAADATADEMADAINSLGTAGLVSVDRSTTNTARETHVWTVTFLEMGGNVDELDVSADNLISNGAISAVVAETNEGTGDSGLSGTFYLGYDNGGGIVWNWADALDVSTATADEFETALEALEGVGKVVVSRNEFQSASVVWSVTFMTLDTARPTISIESTAILPAAASVSASKTQACETPGVYRVIVSASTSLGGTFTLSYDGVDSAPLNYNASARDATLALQAEGLFDRLKSPHPTSAIRMVCQPLLGTSPSLLQLPTACRP
jgi:hypothetical protein